MIVGAVEEHQTSQHNTGTGLEEVEEEAMTTARA
jgi:hypothetical protein